MPVVDEQQRAVKVLSALLVSHQGLMNVAMTRMQFDTVEASNAFAAAGLLLQDLRLGELRIERWMPPQKVICSECGYMGEGNAIDSCPECGGNFAEV